MRSLMIVLLFCGSTCAMAQSRLPPGVRGPESGMATRSVSAYLALERNLLDALRSGNHNAVAAMLADDFGARSPAAQDEVSKADWLSTALRDAAGRSDDVRDLAVREFDDVAVVSFVLDHRRGTKGPSARTTDFVVDVWRQSTHRLLVRNVARSVDAAPPPSRPTGRE